MREQRRSKIRESIRRGRPPALPPFVRPSQEVEVHVPADCRVMLDPMLCGLIFDHAISNAWRHGARPDPRIRLTVRCTALEPQRQRLAFALVNAAHPNRPPVTKQFVQQVLQSKGTSSNVMLTQSGLKHVHTAAELHGMHVELEQNDGEVWLGGFTGQRPTDGG